jgi:hypothetical protein
MFAPEVASFRKVPLYKEIKRFCYSHNFIDNLIIKWTFVESAIVLVCHARRYSGGFAEENEATGHAGELQLTKNRYCRHYYENISNSVVHK